MKMFSNFLKKCNCLKNFRENVYSIVFQNFKKKSLQIEGDITKNSQLQNVSKCKMTL